MKLLNIKHERIKKKTPMYNSDIEPFHNALKTDYSWQNDLESYVDAGQLIKHAFNDFINYK